MKRLTRRITNLGSFSGHRHDDNDRRLRRLPWLVGGMFLYSSKDSPVISLALPGHVMGSGKLHVNWHCIAHFLARHFGLSAAGGPMCPPSVGTSVTCFIDMLFIS